MAARIPAARLLILPATHGDYLGEALASGGSGEGDEGDVTLMHATLPLISRFLDVESDPGNT